MGREGTGPRIVAFKRPCTFLIKSRNQAVTRSQSSRRLKAPLILCGKGGIPESFELRHQTSGIDASLDLAQSAIGVCQAELSIARWRQISKIEFSGLWRSLFIANKPIVIDGPKGESRIFENSG